MTHHEPMIQSVFIPDGDQLCPLGLHLEMLVNDGALTADPLARPALSDAAKARLAAPDAPRLKVAADDLLPIEAAATPVDGVVDLMAELERSVAAAKDARKRHRRSEG